MDNLPSELLLTTFSLLTPKTLIVIRNINHYCSKLMGMKWLMQQFQHCYIDDKIFFNHELLYRPENTALLLKISEKCYQQDEPYLYRLVIYCIFNLATCLAYESAVTTSWYIKWLEPGKIINNMDDADCYWRQIYHADWGVEFEDDEALFEQIFAIIIDKFEENKMFMQEIDDGIKYEIPYEPDNMKYDQEEANIIANVSYSIVKRNLLINLPTIISECRKILLHSQTSEVEIESVFPRGPIDTEKNPFGQQFKRLFPNINSAN